MEDKIIIRLPFYTINFTICDLFKNVIGIYFSYKFIIAISLITFMGYTVYLMTIRK